MPEPARPRERIARAFQICGLLRCAQTGHPVGTDTWAEGYWCPCFACQTVKNVADALLAASAPDAATPCTGACARHCPAEGRDEGGPAMVTNPDGTKRPLTINNLREGYV